MLIITTFVYLSSYVSTILKSNIEVEFRRVSDLMFVFSYDFSTQKRLTNLIWMTKYRTMKTYSRNRFRAVRNHSWTLRHKLLPHLH